MTNEVPTIDLKKPVYSRPALESLTRRRKLLPYHRFRIEMSLTQARHKGKLTKSLNIAAIIRQLEKDLSQIDFSGSNSRILTRDRNRWAKIAKHLSIAKNELSTLESPTGETPELRQAVYDSLESSREFAKKCSEIIALEKVGSNAEREAAYSIILKAWTDAGGRLKTQHKQTTTHGPLATYFFAVVEPILGESSPDLSALQKIISRERSRRRTQNVQNTPAKNQPLSCTRFG